MTEVTGEDFENVYDVPFITVNRIDGLYEAEVIFSGDEAVDQARLQTALDVGASYGVYVHAVRPSDYPDDDVESVTIHFTADPIGSLVEA